MPDQPHFDNADATGPNCTPYAISFLLDRIGSRWHQQNAESSLGHFCKRILKFLCRSRVKRDSQCQQVEVQDWASYLEHVQSTPLEFGTAVAPNGSHLIRFLCEGVKLSGKAEVGQWVENALVVFPTEYPNFADVFSTIFLSMTIPATWLEQQLRLHRLNGRVAQSPRACQVI